MRRTLHGMTSSASPKSQVPNHTQTVDADRMMKAERWHEMISNICSAHKMRNEWIGVQRHVLLADDTWYPASLTDLSSGFLPNYGAYKDQYSFAGFHVCFLSSLIITLNRHSTPHYRSTMFCEKLYRLTFVLFNQSGNSQKWKKRVLSFACFQFETRKAKQGKIYI